MSEPSAILYENKLIGSTISTSGEDVDTFKENAIGYGRERGVYGYYRFVEIK